MGDGGSPEHTQGSTEAVDRRNTSKELWLPSSSGVGTAPTFRKEEHKKREGFVCFMVTIHSVKGVRFGLGIKHFNDQVIVSKSEKAFKHGEPSNRTASERRSDHQHEEFPGGCMSPLSAQFTSQLGRS
ncbi:hypothetical protein OSTOST_01075 [Ostertagia ostertagi]